MESEMQHLINANRVKKRDLLRRIHKLTMRLADAIGTDDIDGLTDALNGRKRLTIEIEALDHAYQELLTLNAAKAHSGNAAEASETEVTLTEQMCGIILETLNLDAKNSENAKIKLEQYKTDLKRELKSTKRVHSYMGLYQPIDSAYIDSKK